MVLRLLLAGAEELVAGHGEGRDLLPLARLRISGSRVRRPVSRTLFTVRSPSRSVGCADLDPASPADDAGHARRRAAPARIGDSSGKVAGPGGRARGGAAVRRAAWSLAADRTRPAALTGGSTPLHGLAGRRVASRAVGRLRRRGPSGVGLRTAAVVSSSSTAAPASGAMVATGRLEAVIVGVGTSGGPSCATPGSAR